MELDSGDDILDAIESASNEYFVKSLLSNKQIQMMENELNKRHGQMLDNLHSEIESFKEEQNLVSIFFYFFLFNLFLFNLFLF